MKIGSNKIIKLLKPNELGKFFNISKTTVYRLVDARKIPFYKIEGSIRFKENDVSKYLEKNRIDPI